MRDINNILRNLPLGYSEVLYEDIRYGLTTTAFNNGKSLKVFAEALGATDFISLNYYKTKDSEYLKPCEMPEEKVIHFLRNFKPIADGN